MLVRLQAKSEKPKVENDGVAIGDRPVDNHVQSVQGIRSRFLSLKQR